MTANPSIAADRFQRRLNSVVRPQKMKWLDTTVDQDTSASSTAFWDSHRSALKDGTFWADRIVRYCNQPIERLKLAIDNLPLPAAFREAVVAIRALVRARLFQKEDFTDELVLLYWLAAIESFGVPYSEILRQPGFNVLESIPGQVIKALPFTYAQLGYKQLSLFNKTDTKWCIARWGEPVNHTILNQLHSELWHKYEVDEQARQARQRQEHGRAEA